MKSIIIKQLTIGSAQTSQIFQNSTFKFELKLKKRNSNLKKKVKLLVFKVDKISSFRVPIATPTTIVISTSVPNSCIERFAPFSKANCFASKIFFPANTISILTIIKRYDIIRLHPTEGFLASYTSKITRILAKIY